MALVEPTKKGGRYTIKEQEERRIQVYHLHFEENKSAVKIAEILNVNRNTINEDIKFWEKQFANDIKIYDLVSKIKLQIQKMEMQRERLHEDLEKIDIFSEKIIVEKFINDIDNKLIQFYSKIMYQGKNSLESNMYEEIHEEEVKEFVRELIFSDDDPHSEDIYFLNDLKHNFIKKTKCNLDYSEKIIKKMFDDGLSLCEKIDPPEFKVIHTNFPRYVISKFALMRGYLTKDEIVKISNKRTKQVKKIEEEEERQYQIEQKEEQERKDRFIKKYGSVLKWSNAVWDRFYSYEEP
ncbi:hypothetical protein [Nitrosopumilus sp. S6]